MPIEHTNEIGQNLRTNQIGRILEYRFSGKLTKEDYDQFAPQVEIAIKTYGKVRLLLILRDFHGWRTDALWEEIKFDVKHFSDIERIAMVGDKAWEKWMASFCKPFTNARVKYFDASDIEVARFWIAKRSRKCAGVDPLG